MHFVLYISKLNRLCRCWNLLPICIKELLSQKIKVCHRIKKTKTKKKRLTESIDINLLKKFPQLSDYGHFNGSLSQHISIRWTNLLYTPLQIPNSLRDKFSEILKMRHLLLIMGKNRDHAKCFLIWENHVSLRIYLIELYILSQNELNMSY